MKIIDLFHALRRGTAKNKERGTTTGPEKPRQTDSAKSTTSGDVPAAQAGLANRASQPEAQARASRERPAFDFKQLPDVDDATVEAFFSATHEGSRRMPLLVAQWVYAQLENELTSPVRLDERRLAEIRGGMMALRRFAVDYTQGIDAWKQCKKRKDGDAQ